MSRKFVTRFQRGIRRQLNTYSIASSNVSGLSPKPPKARLCRWQMIPRFFPVAWSWSNDGLLPPSPRFSENGCLPMGHRLFCSLMRCSNSSVLTPRFFRRRYDLAFLFFCFSGYFIIHRAWDTAFAHRREQNFFGPIARNRVWQDSLAQTRSVGSRSTTMTPVLLDSLIALRHRLLQYRFGPRARNVFRQFTRAHLHATPSTSGFFMS